MDGKVQMERAWGQGLERAILNSPVIEGSRIVTGTDGLAEVEFEDNTTVRLGENTEIRFPQLVVNDPGERVNEVYLVRGTIYFDTRGDKHDINRVIAADRTFVLKHDSQIRFMTIGEKVQAAVMKGEASLDNNGQIVQVKKNDTVTLDATNPAGFSVAQGVDSLPLDKWNNERAAYQTAYSNNGDVYGAKHLGVYGFSDLSYYGNFMNLPGYGLAWQPYGVSSWGAWNPYMVGAWTFLDGGYAWASPYPWGWMPYHYGSWAYQTGLGWFWYPGNSFRGGNVGTTWVGTAPVVNAPAGFSAPVAPVVSTNGPSPTVVVGRVGNAAAFIPDGRVPPNFRSVINDRSGLTGSRSPSYSTAAGSGTSVPNSRAVAPRQASQSGHVFAAPPQPSIVPSMNASYGPSAAPAGGGFGSTHSSSTGMHSAGHAGSWSAGHSGGSATSPK
jgi:hypothetical protein